MPSSPFALAREQLKQGKLAVLGSPSLLTYPFVMRVDQGPFADVRVRRAMKLVADRQALVDVALSGMGSVQNDLFGAGLPDYASDLTISRDVDQARSLIKQAGLQNHTFTLRTSAFASGVVEAATLFAQQASAAGIKIDIKQESPANYFTPAGGLLSDPLRQSYYLANGSLNTYYSEFLSSSSSINETYWGHQPGGDRAWKLIDQAAAATDPALAKELWHEVQVQQAQEGGFLIWGNAYSVNLVAPHVNGLRETPLGALDDGHLMDCWIA